MGITIFIKMSTGITKKMSFKALDRMSSIKKLKKNKSKPYTGGTQEIRPAPIDLGNPNSPARLWPNLLQKDSNDKQSNTEPKKSTTKTPKKDDLKNIFMQ